MPNRTKKAIARATQELLKEKPLNKITVKEITDRCELTRNSFYYHFSDIYDVVNFIFENEVVNMVDEYVDSENWEAGFLSGIQFLYDNKDMIYHIYRTLQHENVDRYIGNIMNEIVFRLIDHIDVPENTSNEAKKIAALVYRNAFAGVIQQWIKDDMRAPQEAIAVLCNEIFRATIVPMITSADKALNNLGVSKIIEDDI